MIFDKAVRGVRNSVESPQILTLNDSAGWTTGGMIGTGKSRSMKLSAVNACVECITNSMSKLPVYVFNGKTKEHIQHPLLYLLATRPNEAMTPSVYKKLMEANRLLGGNAYALIMRNPRSARPRELIPLSPDCCFPFIDDNGKLWYIYTNPRTGEMRKLNQFDVLHYKAYSEDGITGVSVLTRASEVIQTSMAAQRYESKFYSQGAQPSGVLTVAGELDKGAKDKVRAEWNKIHSGADNAFRIAVLDMGIDYKPISISNKDAQFVESKAVTVEDVSRFFGVPPYKLGAGKQSYDSNEQNGIEYVVNTLHPIVSQCDEEDSYKLLFDSELKRRLWIQRNMMAELKGDEKSRGFWYKTMRETGVFSPNDICALEDIPNVPGGDTRYANLNFVPLDMFRELSEKRNQGGGESK